MLSPEEQARIDAELDAEFLACGLPAPSENPLVKLQKLVGQGWRETYKALFGADFVSALAPHHIEAIEWHWDSRMAFLNKERPEYLAYFPIWSRGHMKCLSKGTRILMGDGSQKNIEDIRDGEVVQSFDERSGQLRNEFVLKQWATGQKDCVKLTTRSGWELIGTPDHRVRTFEGWKTIGELQPTDRIASPRRCFNNLDKDYDDAYYDEELRLLTYFLAEGCTVGDKATITNADAVIVQDVIDCAFALGFDAGKTAGQYNTSVRKGVRPWLKQHGLSGKKATEKRLPELFFHLPPRQVRMVLAAWLDTDGFISTQSAGINLANEGLIDDLRYLCLQLGIVTKKYYLPRKGFGSWVIEFDHHDIQRLSSLPLKLKQDNWQSLCSKSRYSLIDTYPQNVVYALPKGVNRKLRRELGWKPSYTSQRVTRDKIQRAMEVHSIPLWTWLENADVYWDEIKSIEAVGVHETYDLEINNTHNFIANGLVTHNSSIAERLVIMDGVLSYVKQEPGYCLYLSKNKDKVQEHIGNIESLLSSPNVRQWCPKLSNPSKKEITNQQKKWTSTFLKSEANYSIQGGTLDSGLAGSRVEETRVTFIVPDDIDGREDSPVIAEARFRQLTTEILPMRQANTLVFFAQNLISRYSVMYRIHTGQARVLTNRKPADPIPAVENLHTETMNVGGIVKDVFVSGTPTWHIWTKERVQDEIDTEGLESFKRECQHEVAESKEGLILYNYDDNVHVISESEFASVYGSLDAWLRWRKKCGNDWARTKTDKHANVAGWLTVSAEGTPLPGMTFFMYPMSFPADSAPEDVAERLLSCLSPYTKDEKGEKMTWEQLRKDTLRRINADRFTSSIAEKIKYEHGELSRVLPRYVKPLLTECNVQQGDMSHERDDVRRIYNSVYGLPMKGVNPKKHGGTELINRQMKVDYAEKHPFRDTDGYTQWFMVVPDDKNQDAREVNGMKVYPPEPYPVAMMTKDIDDSQLARFHFSNVRYRPPILTATGEEIDVPEKIYDDFFNLLQMFAVGSQLTGSSLTNEQKVALMMPQDVVERSREAKGGLEKLIAAMNYESEQAYVQRKLGITEYDGLEDYE